MDLPAVGDVVIVNFPFSDLRFGKRRPALVLAQAEYGDMVLCLITSRPFSSSRTVTLEKQAFAEGGLRETSYIRYDKLATLDRTLIGEKIGHLKTPMTKTVLERVRSLFV
ncbi:MAG: type II toxin-antitoxin system PemK/MazF family toxin [Candidatus Saccharimonadales bacterium]